MREEEQTRDNAEGEQLTLPGVMDDYQVKLEVFEGPLDLLLHLIRSSELDVTDISIAKVSEQYLEYLDLMRELDIDIAGDYLVTAATLALIKSRMLLPPRSCEEEGEEVDPAAQLLERLLDYKRYKEAAGQLAKRDRLGREVFAVRTPPPAPAPDAEREIEVGLFELIKAYQVLLDRVVEEPMLHAMEREHVSVRSCMSMLMNVLESRDSVEFQELFEVAGVELSRSMLVGTFMALLELTRIMAIRVFQSLDEHGAPDGPIRLRARDEGREEWTKRVAEGK